MPSLAKVHSVNADSISVVVATTESVIGRDLVDANKNHDFTLDYLVGMSGITLVSIIIPNNHSSVKSFLSRLRSVSDENRLAFTKYGFDDLEYSDGDVDSNSTPADFKVLEDAVAEIKSEDSVEKSDSLLEEDESSESDTKEKTTRRRYSRRKNSEEKDE